MAKALSSRRVPADDQGNDRLAHMLFDVCCSIFLRTAANLSQKDNDLCLLILLIKLYGVPLCKSPQRSSADRHNTGLPYTGIRQRLANLIRQRAALRNDTDTARHEKLTG